MDTKIWLVVLLLTGAAFIAGRMSTGSYSAAKGGVRGRALGAKERKTLIESPEMLEALSGPAGTFRDFSPIAVDGEPGWPQWKLTSDLCATLGREKKRRVCVAFFSKLGLVE